MQKQKHHSADLFLDRYLPSANPKEREAALVNLQALAQVLIEIDDRISRDNRIRAKSECAVEFAKEI